MSQSMNWGILGTGKIANRFATALSNLEEANLAAVASRQADSANAFADTYNIPTRHVGYEAMAADPEIDIVYIGTPHVFHLRDAAMCLAAGKHILCEKPLTLNATEAEELIALARDKGVFLMEAMWTRFFPLHLKVREMITDGVLGDLLALHADFCYCAPRDLQNRFYRKDLGASVLLDAGSYCISFAHSLFGSPEQVTALAVMGETEVDYQSSILMRFAGGELATLATSMISPDAKGATIIGSKGRLEIHPAWYKPEAMTLHLEGEEPQQLNFPLGDFNGYEYEAREVMACIQDGRTESETMPLDESLAIMRILDGIRQDWGLSYPTED